MRLATDCVSTLANVNRKKPYEYVANTSVLEKSYTHVLDIAFPTLWYVVRKYNSDHYEIGRCRFQTIIIVGRNNWILLGIRCIFFFFHNGPKLNLFTCFFFVYICLHLFTHRTNKVHICAYIFGANLCIYQKNPWIWNRWFSPSALSNNCAAKACPTNKIKIVFRWRHVLPDLTKRSGFKSG